MPKGQGHIISPETRLKMVLIMNPYHKLGIYFSKHSKRWHAIRRNGTYERFSRIVAINIIGRELKKGEAVHHIDFDKTNDSISNLSVMSNAAHTILHNSGFKKGHIPSAEHRRRLSIAGMGRKHTEETRNKISATNLGKNIRIGWKHSDETKRKISISGKGYKRFLGRKHSKETLIKMSIVQIKRREMERNQWQDTPS